ncbi:PAR3 protein, partial [Amia calva]|nr:PAR3 protein [Amia calva]
MLSFKVHYHLNDNNWILGEAMCKMVTAAFYGNLYCSIYIIMCIGVKRCMAIVFPFAYRTLPKRRCTILSCILVWITVTCAMLPQFMIKQSYPLSLLEITTCHDVLPLMDLPKAYLFYYLCMTLVGFFIPFLVTTLCYISIVWQLDRSDHERIYYVRMCVLVLIIFTLCFMPSNVILFIHYVKLYTSNEGNFYSYHSAAVCLCSLHSCLDPFLFVFMSRTSGYKHKRISFNGNNLSLST